MDAARDLDIDEVAALIYEAAEIFDTLDAREARESDGTRITRAATRRMVRAVVVLGLLRFPSLADEEVLAHALRVAAARSATGVPN